MLLSFPTGSAVERRVDVSKPLVGGRQESAGDFRDFRVIAVTAAVGVSAPVLREWLITSQVCVIYIYNNICS